MRYHRRLKIFENFLFVLWLWVMPSILGAGYTKNDVFLMIS